MTTPTEEINAWIKEHGSCRDALNIALARLRRAEDEVKALKSELMNCSSLSWFSERENDNDS